MAHGVLIELDCASCPAVVVVDACGTCGPDDARQDGCEECNGNGWTVDGEPADADDVTCHACWTREQQSRTADWYG